MGKIAKNDSRKPAPTPPETPPPAPPPAFPIVGIGASAGGLEALEQFLRHVPDDSGMAFVIVQLALAGSAMMIRGPEEGKDLYRLIFSIFMPTIYVATAVTAVLVVRWVLNFISRNGYGLFGWWRIIVGSVALGALWMGY